MAFIKNKIQKTSMAIRVLCLVLGIVLVSGVLIYVNRDDINAKGESAIAPSSKDYLAVILDRMTKGLQDDFTILEIVPYQGAGEYRFYANSAEVETGILAKAKSELQRLYNLQGGSGRKDEWLPINTYFQGLGYQIRYNYRADKYDIEATPLFQNNVLTEKVRKALDGKVKVNTVEANDLTEADITNADLIVLTSTASSENILKAYNYITENVLGSGDANITTGVYANNAGAYEELTTDKFAQITYDTYELLTDGTYVSRDISWDMTKKLIEALANGRNLKGDGTKYITPVVMNGTLTEGSLSATSNMYKLATIIRMMDNSKYADFVQNHMTTVNAAGAGLVTTTGIPTAGFAYTNTSGAYTVISDFTSDDVVNSGVYSGEDFITTTPNDKYRVANNYVAYADADRIMASANVLSSTAYEGLADRGLTDKTVADALRYVIGCKDTVSATNQLGVIRVLEVQPTRTFDYGSKASIAAALGVSESQVEITSVHTKELNSLTTDMISAFDIVYIGMNSNTMAKMASDSTKTVYNDKNLNGYVYLAFGDLVKGSTALMGLFPWEYKAHTGSESAITNYKEMLDKDYGAVYSGSSFDSFRNNHSGMIIIDKIPADSRYSYVNSSGEVKNNIKWKDYTNYVTNNSSVAQQLKVNYLYKYNAETSILFNDYQKQFFSTFDNSKVYALINIQNYFSSYVGSNAANVMDTLYADKVGNCRLSDNDITAKTLRKLKDFADSGKLIVLEDAMYEKDSYKVYPTSHMYELLEYVTSEETDTNCIKRSDLKDAVATHVNVKAPLLTFTNKPADVQYDGDIVKMPTNTNHNLNFSFTTSGAANTTYKVKVIVDKNGDGIYADDGKIITDDTNEIYKTQIYATDENGNASVSISVKLPDKENGLVAYKLEVVEMNDGTETKLRSALYGYTLVKSYGDPENIKVLQIVPYQQLSALPSYNDTYASGGRKRYGHLDMTYSLNALGQVQASDNDFKTAMSKVKPEIVGYNLSIEIMYTHLFEDKFNPNTGGKRYYAGTSYDTDANYLLENNYDMVIIGFEDSYLYDDISNFYGAMDCIKDFIKHDKAVMFSHDTMSFCTTVNYGMVDTSGGSLKRARYSWLNDSGSDTGGGAKICQSLSQGLRNLVGLDRYGATINTADRDEKDKPTYANGINMSYTSASGDGKYYVEELHGFTDWNLWRECVIKYWVKNDSYSGINMINPYTNCSIGTANGSGKWTNTRSTWNTKKIEKVNTGQVTMFPFKIPDVMNIAETHAQYYQLDMEDKEVVVWYTLKGNSGHYYDVNAKDGQNQYYIYSKGSVTYTGAGHSKIGESQDELKLFINTIIKTITAKNNKPSIEVTNGSLAGAGYYNIYSDTPDDYELKFKVTDNDLTTLDSVDGRYEDLGRYKSGQVVWDKDKDGIIDPEDVVLEVYGELSPTGKILYNGVVNTIDVMNNPNLSEEDKNEIRRQISEESGIEFIIQATDSRDETSSARAKITLKPLFNLD